jgi:hypothetical protein
MWCFEEYCNSWALCVWQLTTFIYTTATIIRTLTNTKQCSRNFKNYSVQISLFLYNYYFGLGPDATGTQYLSHTAPNNSTFTLSSNTRPMLRRSTKSPVACEHKNRSLVNTRTPRYAAAVSPWHGSLAIRWTPAVSSWEWLHCHPLWSGSPAILSLPRHGKISSPSAVALWHGSLAMRWTPAVSLYYCLVFARRTPEGRIPWVDCLAIRWIWAYIALSHFSNVGHSSRQH